MISIPLSEAMRSFSRRIIIIFKGIKKYKGDDEQICTQIIKECFNKEKKYFMVSNGHFTLFYSRDFGWCVEALLGLGYRRQVLGTLDYVLGIYQEYGRVTQSISLNGKPFTFPNRYSPDALAFLTRSLKLAKAKSLVNKYKDFLNKEIKRYYELVIDEKTGLVKKEGEFSSMKDHYLRQSSCYDNVMTGMLAMDLGYFKGLNNPFKKYDYKKLLVDNFWTGSYFLDDISGQRIVTGDASTLPFWSGLIDNPSMIKKAIETVRKEKLDKPFPLKYTSAPVKGQKTVFEHFLVPGYETDSVWVHVGMMYIKVVSLIDKKLARKYLGQYRKLILKHRNFLELYDRKGKPFQSLLYYTDESMLWAANYLYLKKLLY